MDKLQNAIDKCAPVFVTEYGTTNDIAQGDFNPVRSQQWFANLLIHSFLFLTALALGGTCMKRTNCPI